jgi:hypothetical protein
VWLSAVSGLWAQTDEVFPGFLRRPPLEEYRNYAETQYHPYRAQLRQDPRYNYFGEFLADGWRAFRLEEQRPGTSLIAKDQVYRSLFNNLLITHTSYKGVNAALTVGDEVRTTLTPFTLQQAGASGVRWELEYPNNRVTFLVERGFDASDFLGYPSFSSPANVEREVSVLDREVRVVEERPVYTWGGRWETQVGDVLSLGATFLNQQHINTMVDQGDGYLRGGIPYADMLPPSTLILRCTDDSPEDGQGGAAVSSVVLEIEATASARDTLLSSDPASPFYSPALVPVRTGGHPVQGHWQADGEEQLDYTFTLPKGLTSRRARFTVVVANDYRIAVSQIHPFSAKTRQTPFFTLRRAPGNIQDLSNRQQLLLEYGLSSGQTLYGLDLAADLVGLKLRGEVVMNPQYQKFPVAAGHPFTAHGRAAYLNLVKTFHQLQGLALGGEVFYVGPQYSGGYDSRRGGVVLYTDRGGSGSDAVTAEYPLVEDNDDHDRYADDNINDYPTGQTLEAGVYPGLDEDHDNIPDDDKNANGVPDYQEPFMLYGSDPPEFVYGLDLNNNGVIDVRENDNKPDYPYDRDRRGQHYTASVQPLPGLQLGAGHYRMQAIASAERAVSSYVWAAYRYQIPRWAEIRLNHDSKRVRDNIPDSVYVYDPVRNVTPSHPPDPDPLLEQNSWVHTSFVGTRFNRLVPLTIENNLLVLDNRIQDLPDTPLSEQDQRRTLTMVNKVDGRWQWGSLTVRPMYKHLWQRQTLHSRYRPSVSKTLSAPILRLDYKLNDNLLLQFGQQGIRLWGIDRRLAFHSVDRINPFNSYSSTDFMFMLTLKGSYLGNSLTSSTGVHLQSKHFDDANAGQNQRFTRLFVEVVAGLERL